MTLHKEQPVSVQDVMDAFPGSSAPTGIDAAIAQAGRKILEPLPQEGFIEALFGRTAGYIRLRAFHPVTKAQETAIVRGPEAVREFAEKWKDTHDVYFSVATTKFGEQSTKKEVVEIVTAHVDLDVHDATQQSATFKKLVDFSPTPSIIVFSGGGFHAYWLLSGKTGAEGIDKIETLNRRMIKLLGADPGTHDCVRLLRLPETINHKPEYKTPSVDIVFVHPDVRRRLA